MITGRYTTRGMDSDGILDLSASGPNGRRVYMSSGTQTDKPEEKPPNRKECEEPPTAHGQSEPKVPVTITEEEEYKLISKDDDEEEDEFEELYEEVVTPEDAIDLDRAELPPDEERPVPIDVDPVQPPSEPEPEPVPVTSTPPSKSKPLPLVDSDVNSSQKEPQPNPKPTTATTTAKNTPIAESRRAQTCQICGKVLAHVSSLYRHYRLQHNPNKNQPKGASKVLKKGLTMMIVDESGNPTAPCNLCGENLHSLAELRQHKLLVHKLNTSPHTYAMDNESMIEH